MELDERKKKILQAVIRNYLETGEPVASIISRSDSSSTISLAFSMCSLPSRARMIIPDYTIIIHPPSAIAQAAGEKRRLMRWNCPGLTIDWGSSRVASLM